MKSDRDTIHTASKKLYLLGSINRHDILNQVMVALGYPALPDEMVPAGSEYHEYCRQATGAPKRIQRQINFTRDYRASVSNTRSCSRSPTSFTMPPMSVQGSE